MLPSFAEGLPVVIMEALALGRPVVATRITGIPELVRDGENGRLVTASNVGELTEALRWIMNAPAEQLDEMGRAGRELARRRHSVEGEVARLRALFARALRGGGEG